MFDKYSCPKCGARMERKATIDQGDSEGRNSSCLYQCPQCKNIEEVLD